MKKLTLLAALSLACYLVLAPFDSGRSSLVHGKQDKRPARRGVPEGDEGP
jgi:hypothetical protein